MDSMGIAAMSISLNSAKLQMAVGTSVAKKAMDFQEQTAQQLLEMIPSATGLGDNIDVSA